MIDLITNSSTEIFVDSESSIKPAKALLAELLKMEHSLKTVDEVFTFNIRYESDALSDILSDRMDEYDEETYKEIGLDTATYQESWKIVEQYLEDIDNGKRERPKYFEEIMDNEEINVDTILVITSNDSKYDHFLGLLKTFLYSPDYQEGYQ
jgi:hypothetical protein